MLSKSQSRAWGVPGVSSSIWGPQLGAAPSSLCHRWLRALGDVPSPSWVHLGCHGHPSRPSPRPRGCPPVCLSHRFLSVLPTLAACPVVTTLSPLPGGGPQEGAGVGGCAPRSIVPTGRRYPLGGVQVSGRFGSPPDCPRPPPKHPPWEPGTFCPISLCQGSGGRILPPGPARAAPCTLWETWGSPRPPQNVSVPPPWHGGSPWVCPGGVCVCGGVGGQGCAQPWGSALGPLLLPQRGRGSGIWTVRRGDATGTPSWSQVGGVWGGTRLLVLPWGGGVGGC